MYPYSYIKIKIDQISTSTRLMVTTLGRLHPMITWPYQVTWLIKKRYISTSTRPMTAKLDKAEVYSKGPASIGSFDALVVWSNYQVINEKRYISTSARPCLPNLTESWVLMWAYYRSSDATCWWRSHIRSHHKRKML